MTNSCLILAAGDGTRMKSAMPKVLCKVLDEPMIGWVVDSVLACDIEKVGAIVGNGAELVKAYLDTKGKVAYFEQTERRGTAHAVMQGGALFDKSYANTLVLCGDAPFIDADVIKSALTQHISEDNDITVVSALLDNPFGYGRIKRENDKVTGIVEEKDCTADERQIKEINSGVYWFKSATLREVLPQIKPNNVKNEYYLTDTVALAEKVNAHLCENADIILGANSRADLSALNRIARDKVLQKHMENGVDFPLTDGIIIGKDVVIGTDSVILPNTIIKGKTIIGKGCTIGANSMIDNCKIGDNVTLNNVQAVDSVIDDKVKAGPFVHIRPNSHLKQGVKIGDFVEVKNAVIGENTALAHLTYIGDSDVGQRVNFGCGVVTANYDGINKHRTTIGNDCFIGCNTNLIAPVKIGDNATTAAGSTITKDVPENALAIERGETRVKENWAHNKKRLEKMNK